MTMSILSGPEIESIVARTRVAKAAGSTVQFPSIDIIGMRDGSAGPNSVDLHLSNQIAWYESGEAFGEPPSLDFPLDPRKNNEVYTAEIEPTGRLLTPGTLYLCAVEESIEVDGYVPWVDGRSSVGRLGIMVHLTAGRGDDGWKGRFTLEIAVLHPVIVYPGMRIAQVTFFTIQGDRRPYQGKYLGATGPESSKMHQDKTTHDDQHGIR